MKEAIIITGAVCSGKTSISNKISKDINFKLINEENTRPFNLHNLKKQLQIHKSENVIIEHTDILNYYDEIKKCFNIKVLIYINTSNEVLLKNIEARKNNNATGDYININAFKQKELIKNQLKHLNLKHSLIYLNILYNQEYDKKYKKLINMIKKIV